MTTTTTRRFPPAATPWPGGARGPRRGADPGLDALLADPELTSTAKAVAVALARHWAWGDKDHCWPGDRAIAMKVGRSVGSVQRALRELEGRGLIRREHTDEVPNGRRIWLLWRQGAGGGMSTGAQPGQSSARITPCAPAPTEEIRNREPATEAKGEEVSPRPRPEPLERTPVPGPVAPPEPVGMTAPATEPSAPVPAIPGLTGAVPEAGPVELPPAPRPTPPAAPTAATRKRRGLGLTLEELSRIASATADPILARELAKLTAPPPPPEPPAAALPTDLLLVKLPGRHDLISAITTRLCQDTRDFKTRTWAFFEKAARAVAGRQVGAGVLLSCYRQATGPGVRDPGRLFVSCWKREAGRETG